MSDHPDLPSQQARIRALEAEIAILRAADTDPDDTKLIGVHGEPGHITVALRPPELLMRAFIASMIDMLGDATNYVEMEASNPSGPGRYLVRVERAGGKSPHTLRQEAETQAHALQAQVDAVTALHAPETYYHRATPYGWAVECDHCYEPVRDPTGALTPTHFEDEHGELRCRTRPRRTCTHCLSNWGEEMPWPCDTAQLLQKDQG